MPTYIDFETRGTVELSEVGIDVYTRHPDTDVWCLGYAENDEEPEIWAPGLSRPMFAGSFVAHNAAFELAVWNNILVPRYGWSPLKITEIRCTMAAAYAMGLPGSLEKAAAALGISQQKDVVGHRLMLQMSRPKAVTGSTIEWWDDVEKVLDLHAYCKQDVRVERELDRRLLHLSEYERRVWQIDYAINQRGIAVDTPAIRAAVTIIDIEASRLNNDLRRVTGNAVGFTTEVAQLTKWIRRRGVGIESLAKADVIDALELDNMPEDVRAALLIRQEAGKTSNKKLSTLLTIQSADGRVRDTMQYHGASTGRWAGRRLQPQNMPRPHLSQAEIETVLDQLPKLSPQEAIAWIGLLFGSPLSVLSDCLRGMICAAPGHTLMAADFSNIEGRVLAWLAGEEWKLDAFRAYDRHEGPDLYVLGYSKSFHIPIDQVTKDQRQIGKVQELALGYQGGVGAFQTLARGYGITVGDARAEEIKTAWRDAHSHIVQYWYDLETASYNAVRYPGHAFTAHTITYKKSGSFLFCQLPSGRVLTYPYPQLRTVDTSWGEPKEAVTYMTVVDQQTQKKAKILPDPNAHRTWQRVATYGGKLAENVTQAVSRDILAEALVRCEDHGYPVCLHVHDEVVTEVPENRDLLPGFLVQMATSPLWCQTLPISVEGWRGKRYRK